MYATIDVSDRKHRMAITVEDYIDRCVCYGDNQPKRGQVTPAQTTVTSTIDIRERPTSSANMRSERTFSNGKIFFAIICILIVTYISKKFIGPETNKTEFQMCDFQPPSTPLWHQTLDFNKLNFSNETGNPTGCYVVPNHIHYIAFGGKPIDYLELICILSVYQNQRPDKITFHYEMNSTFTGKYWKVIHDIEGLRKIIELNNIEVPSEIFGQPLSDGWRTWHASDVTRIKTIMTYGGIYLDSDCYLIKSIDTYRKFEISINWEEGGFLGNQVIVAHKDARFLRKWLETYRVYDNDKWYYNGGERPTIEVLYKEPELIHRDKVTFGIHTKYNYVMFGMNWKDWKQLYTVHLMRRHQYMLPNVTERATYPVEFNETNIVYYPITFREMAYDVYDTANVDWPRDKLD